MTSKTCIRTVLVILALAIIIPSIGVAHANYGYVKSTPATEYGTTSGSTTGTNSIPLVKVCIFQPIDFTMDPSLPSLILAEVKHDNVAGTIVNIANQSFHNYNCGHIIKIDRSINQNYRFTDKTTKYQVSGNVLTIFTYKTGKPTPGSLGGGTAGAASGKSSGGGNPIPMTNWDCEMQAHTTTFHSNYHISQNGYVDAYTSKCNPYSSNHPVSDELPINVIKQSVDMGLKKLGL